MFSISHEQTQLKVFCFQNVDALLGSPFQIILYVMVICISASKKMRVKFLQKMLYLQRYRKNNNKKKKKIKKKKIKII